MAELIAKENATFKLRVRSSDHGVRFVLHAVDSGYIYGDYQTLTLDWADWERLKTWVEYQRAELAVKPKA